MSEHKPILCLDFDGVLHSYTSGWKGADVIPDPPVPGAFQFIADAAQHFHVHIYSSRSGQPGGIEAMRQWFEEWDPKGGILSLLSFPTEKPPAFIGIDDRVLTFNGTFPSARELLNFKPWNKR